MNKIINACAISAVMFAFSPLAALAQAQKPAVPMPDGKGKAVVEGVCGACHATTLIQTSSGYTREHWKLLTSMMIDLSKAPETQNEILDYLAANFPPNTNRAPKQVSGTFEIKFTEWVMPQLGQRSRDPVQHPDGSIWYAGQFGNLIGRLDPVTGQAREYPLPDGSNPHTVVLDNDGIPWFSGNKNGTIGKLDPATGKTTVWRMPDPKSDPHTIAFDKHGMVFFSFQASNLIGRLNPKTGELKVVSAPSPKSQPYDVHVDAEGTPWVSCNGRPCMLKVNPQTMDVTEIAMPLPGTTIRRFTIAPDGIFWYVNSGRGQIGRYNPKTGEFKEWASPSGPRSHPYGIAYLDGAIWYNESGMRPDMLVRFDIAKESFQSWPIASGGVYAGILRNARTTREGGLLIHQTATNRVILVTPVRRTASAQ